jgi:hypothetical protein
MERRKAWTGKACNAMICGTRSVAKASEIVAAAEMVCHATNKMSFPSSLEAASASAKSRVSMPRETAASTSWA